MERRGHRPAQTFTVLPGVRQSGADPLAQNLAFELGEHRQQAGHGAPGRRRQIECFRQRYETDSEMLQFLECRDQIRHRPAPAIQSPHQHDIDLAAASGIQQLFPQFPLRSAGTDLLHLQRDGPAPPGGVLAHGADLQREGLLVEGGNAGVEANAKHFRMFPSLAKNPGRLCLLRGLFGGHFRVSLPHGRNTILSGHAGFIILPARASVAA